MGVSGNKKFMKMKTLVLFVILFQFNHIGSAQNMFISIFDPSGLYTVKISENDTLITLVDSIRYETSFYLDEKENPIPNDYFYNIYTGNQKIGEININKNEKNVILKYRNSRDSTPQFTYVPIDQFETSGEFKIYKRQFDALGIQQIRVIYYEAMDLYIPLELTVKYHSETYILHLKLNDN